MNKVFPFAAGIAHDGIMRSLFVPYQIEDATPQPILPHTRVVCSSRNCLIKAEAEEELHLFITVAAESKFRRDLSKYIGKLDKEVLSNASSVRKLAISP